MISTEADVDSRYSTNEATRLERLYVYVDICLPCENYNVSLDYNVASSPQSLVSSAHSGEVLLPHSNEWWKGRLDLKWTPCLGPQDFVQEPQADQSYSFVVTPAL